MAQWFAALCVGFAIGSASFTFGVSTATARLENRLSESKRQTEETIKACDALQETQKTLTASQEKLMRTHHELMSANAKLRRTCR